MAELPRIPRLSLRRAVDRLEFPWRAPTWPGGVDRPAGKVRHGVDYDTAWARRYGARVARSLLLDAVFTPVVEVLASPIVEGLDRLKVLDEPVIIAANHRSHLDTPLLLTSLPRAWRHNTVVAAAADYFFTSDVGSAYAALAFGAIPMERTKVTRRSADLAAGLLDHGWNLVIFPEGGRSPDGWGHEFRGGAAYLSARTGRPVVPVYMGGTGQVLPRGATLPRRRQVTVTFGEPIWPEPREHARRLNPRIEGAVAALADERQTDWWTARRRRAAAATPALTGPDAPAWRREWALQRSAGQGDARRRWPEL